MKKALSVLTVISLFVLSTFSVMAQEETTNKDSVEVTEEASSDTTMAEAADTAAVQEAEQAEQEEVVPKSSGTQVLKKYFIQGGGFMFPVLISLILGLAIAIEKIITLNLKSVNSKRLLEKIEEKLKNNDVEGAQEICRTTRGSVASIFYQAFLRRNNGVADVEKAISSYGAVQMGLLEKGLVWISLFIALAPMLGFMGTVIGMIQAFDQIEQVGDISPSIVAGGIKVALLTTVGGLVVAVILQLFYNYLVSKVDSIVNDMEDASITLVDMMLEYGVTQK